jgi:PAS domain S-box-containing protein
LANLAEKRFFMKVLYVEDDPLDADLTRRALQKNAPFIQLDIARSRVEALGLLDQKGAQYDLMLTDLNLPDGSGFSLLSHVREQVIPIAVIVITGQGDEEIAVSALKAGADDYLVKRQAYLDHLPKVLASAVERHRAEVARRERPLRVLYLEGDPADIDLTRRHFASHAPHIRLEIVHTVGEVYPKLPGGGPLDYDALMLDYRQYDLNALDLLKDLRQLHTLDLPIVLVTGHGDEEIAAQALRLGASDYVVKSPGYLFRLPGLLENAYHRQRMLGEQEALRRSEERFRRLAENAPDVIYRFRMLPQISLEYVSPAIQTISGYSPEEWYADPAIFVRLLYPEDAGLLDSVIYGKQPTGQPLLFRFNHKDGKLIWIEARNVPVFDKEGELIANEGIARDVTERKKSEESIQRQLQRLHALRVVDTAISASLDLRVTLAVLLEHVVKQLGIHAACILLLDAQTEVMKYSAGIGFRSRAVESLRLHMGEGYAGKAALQRCTVHASGQEGTEQVAVFPETLVDEGFVAYYGTPLVAKDQVKGVLEVYHRLPLDPDAEWVNFFETLAGQAAIAIDNAELFASLQRANLELTLAYDRTLEGWVRALDLRDRETQGHTQRVTSLTMRLGRSMGIGDAEMIHIRRGALLHDIGKIGIPDGILHKPGPLSDDEWALMRKHPIYARDLLAPIDYLHQAIEIPFSHHERWNGTGYPQSLYGEQIPLAARIFAVVDVWDALRSDRPYRRAWEHDRVLEYIQSLSGTHFDPEVVNMFLKIADELRDY